MNGHRFPLAVIADVRLPGRSVAISIESFELRVAILEAPLGMKSAVSSFAHSVGIGERNRRLSLPQYILEPFWKSFAAVGAVATASSLGTLWPHISGLLTLETTWKEIGCFEFMPFKAWCFRSLLLWPCILERVLVLSFDGVSGAFRRYFRAAGIVVTVMHWRHLGLAIKFGAANTGNTFVEEIGCFILVLFWAWCFSALLL